MADDEYTARLAKLEAGHQELSRELQAIKSDTASAVEILDAMKGGLKILENLAIVAKWFATIFAPVGMIVGAITWFRARQ